VTRLRRAVARAIPVSASRAHDQQREVAAPAARFAC
jgi:hypothetical protein